MRSISQSIQKHHQMSCLFQHHHALSSLSRYASIILILVVVGVSIIREVEALNDAKYFRQHYFQRRKRPSSPRYFDDSDVQELFLKQPLDHFSTAYKKKYPNATLHQRYFYSSRYVQKNNNNNESSHLPTYVFLYTGGEGPDLDKSVIAEGSFYCSGDMLDLAKSLYKEKKASVHLFALEHRYYGLSYPVFPSKASVSADITSPVSTAHLEYLSSRQALADLARFVPAIIQTNPSTTIHSSSSKITKYTKWIAFGGSYPGMMSAYARLLYPHLIHAAVSSSAPVDITLDFARYKEKVAWDLQYKKIGGSATCFEIVVKGHDQLRRWLSPPLNRTKVREVANLFHICDPETVLLDKGNAEYFLGDGVIYIAAQYNDPACDWDLCNIAKLCSNMVYQYNKLHRTPVTILANISLTQYGIQSGDGACRDVDRDAYLEYLASPILAQEDGTRSWLWQTCTEFGYYQTCDSGNNSSCPYGKGFHPLELDFEVCQVAFGINATTVKRNIKRSLAYYGGKSFHPGTSRILSVNGNVDPWSVLARRGGNSGGPPDPKLPNHIVAGASHCFWTGPALPTDTIEVQIARQIIYFTVKEWLKESN